MSGDHINRPDLYPNGPLLPPPPSCKHTMQASGLVVMAGQTPPYECMFCALEAARAEVISLKAAREQLEVQLAGCSVAALGWSRGDQKAEKGAWGWSQSYQDVVDLRERWEAGNTELASLREANATLLQLAVTGWSSARSLAIYDQHPATEKAADKALTQLVEHGAKLGPPGPPQPTALATPSDTKAST